MIVDRGYDGALRLILRADDTEYIGTGERGGWESKEIHRQAIVYLEQGEIVQLLRTLAANDLPKLQSVDALNLAVRLIKGALPEEVKEPSSPS